MKINSIRERVFNLFNENRFLLLSAGCSAAIMIVVFMCFGLFPFGDTIILRMDLYHQYGPLFSELYDRVTSGGSFLYSFNTGLGSSFLGNYFNYLSSPIGFITILFSGHGNMPEAIAVMVLIKSALSAFTLNLFIKKSLHKSSYVSAAFGVLYSFCGWFIAYYWNIMWVDAMILLPLIALGIERIIDNGKPLTYILSLSLTMLSNYYMSYMMCIFSVLYFLTYFNSNYSVVDKLPTAKIKRNGTEKYCNRFIKSGFMFAFSSLCAAGILAFALLPTFFALQQTSATSGTFPTQTNVYFSAFDFISNHLASVTPTIRSSGEDVLPNVYCGILTLICLPLYLMTKSVSKKEKAFNLLLLSVLYISFSLNTLNYIWHGFHFPNDLPYRQSFMYSFILILIAFKTITRLNEIPNRYILASSCATVLLTVMAQKLQSKNFNDLTLVISIAFAFIYSLVLVTLKDKKYQTVSVSVLLLCCVCSEAIIADTSNYSMDQKKTNYAGDYVAFREVKDYIDENDEEPFYRMELTNLRTRMDPSWYNYNGVSTFSSMAYENVADFQKSLGMYSNRINSYTYYPQTAVYNAMFSLKYIVNNTSTDVLKNSSYYESVYSDEKFNAYKNSCYLPVAFCVDTSTGNVNTSSSDPFDVQNDLFDRATGESDVLIRTFPTNITYQNISPFSSPKDNQIFSYSRIDSSQKGSVTFDFVAEENAEVYIYASTTDDENELMTVKTQEQTVTETLNKNYSYILNIGELQKGDEYSCSVPLNKDSGTVYLYVCYLNNDAFVKGYEKLKKGSITYDKFTDTQIEGNVYASETSLLFTSIPYDKGWEIYVDGEKASENDIIQIGDALLGVYLSEGVHSIKMKFIPRGLYAGIFISVFTITVCALLLIIRQLSKKNRINLFEEIDRSCDYGVFDEICFSECIIESKKAEARHPVLEIITPYEMNEEEIYFDKSENGGAENIS